MPSWKIGVRHAFADSVPLVGRAIFACERHPRSANRRRCVKFGRHGAGAKAIRASIGRTDRDRWKTGLLPAATQDRPWRPSAVFIMRGADRPPANPRAIPRAHPRLAGRAQSRPLAYRPREPRSFSRRHGAVGTGATVRRPVFMASPPTDDQQLRIPQDAQNVSGRCPLWSVPVRGRRVVCDFSWRGDVSRDDEERKRRMSTRVPEESRPPAGAVAAARTVRRRMGRGLHEHDADARVALPSSVLLPDCGCSRRPSSTDRPRRSLPVQGRSLVRPSKREAGGRTTRSGPIRRHTMKWRLWVCRIIALSAGIASTAGTRKTGKSSCVLATSTSGSTFSPRRDRSGSFRAARSSPKPPAHVSCSRPDLPRAAAFLGKTSDWNCLPRRHALSLQGTRPLLVRLRGRPDLEGHCAVLRGSGFRTSRNQGSCLRLRRERGRGPGRRQGDRAAGRPLDALIDTQPGGRDDRQRRERATLRGVPDVRRPRRLSPSS